MFDHFSKTDWWVCAYRIVYRGNSFWLKLFSKIKSILMRDTRKKNCYQFRVLKWDELTVLVFNWDYVFRCPFIFLKKHAVLHSILHPFTVWCMKKQIVYVLSKQRFKGWKNSTHLAVYWIKKYIHYTYKPNIRLHLDFPVCWVLNAVWDIQLHSKCFNHNSTQIHVIRYIRWYNFMTNYTLYMKWP